MLSPGAPLCSPCRAKHDQASAAGPSESEDSGAVVESPPAVDQPLPQLAADAAPLLAHLLQQHLPLPELAGQQLLLPPLPLPDALAAPQLPFLAAAPAAPAVPAPGAMPQPWLMGLFNVALFEHHGCRCHPGTVRNGTVKRNENNQYCLDCSHVAGTGMCKLCLPAHAACCSGRVFQIRKYM